MLSAEEPASKDQAPGPFIARLASRTASTAGSAGPVGSEKAIHASTIATRIPATGVHRPARSRIPAERSYALRDHSSASRCCIHAGKEAINL